MSVKLSDLKLPKVRRVIQCEVNNEPKIITVFNPVGKKRLQLIEILSSVDKTNEENLEIVASTLYKTLIKELVDVDVDMDKVTTLDKYPSLALMEINKEIEEIIFELQYEYVSSQIRRVNHTIIAAMSGTLMAKGEQLKGLIEDLNKHNDLAQ